MATITVPKQNLDYVQMHLEALRAHFDVHFDRGWLAMIIDDLPLETTLLREIRGLLALTLVYEDDLPEIRYGVGKLLEFVAELRRHLLPVLRDRLRVSGFAATRRERNEERIYRQLLCVTFPHNLDRLETLAHDLEGAVIVCSR